MTTTCSRPGCGKALNKGKKYCSNTCSALARERTGKKAIVEYKNIPESVSRMVLEKGGSDEVLREISLFLEEELADGTPVPPLMNKGLTMGDWTLSIDGRDYRPYEALSYEKIRDMLRCGAVKFALEMKIAGVVAPFRTDTGWVVHSPDKELSEVTEANLKRIIPRMMMDILYSALAYGVSFQELVWERKSKYELGLTSSKSGTTSYIVSKVPNSVNPETVRAIIRTDEGVFDGFEQSPVSYNRSETIRVQRESALVVPYNGRFRNLWGESFLLPIYPLWFWYEVVMRSMVRYMHRMATPVTVVKAPGKGKVNKPGTTTQVNPMVLGLAIAGNAANSNALVIPSDVDPETKQPLWDIFYLKADSPTQPFIDVLEFLTQSMLRAALSGDRAMTQPTDATGSGLGEVHAAFTQLHNELILDQVVMFLNQYFMPLYSLYNKGQGGPPVWLETQGLDPMERDNMFKLMGIAGNSQVFQEFFYYVDWKRMAEANSVPVLSDEEVTAMKEKLNQEALDKQEAFQEVQAKFAPAQKPGGIKDQQKPPEQRANAKLEATDIDHYYEYVGKILSGEPVPIMLTRDEIDLIAEHRGFDEEAYKLFRKGEFDENLVKRGEGGKFSKKQGGKKDDLLTLAQSITDEEMRKRALEMVEKANLDALRPEDIANMELALRLFSTAKSYNSVEEAYEDIKTQMKEMGIPGLQDITSITPIPPEEMRDGLLGHYDSDTNSFQLRPDLIESIKEGDPLAIHTFAHELLHSAQEVHREMKDGETNMVTNRLGETSEMHGAILDSTDQTQVERFFGTVEGQNELLTRVFMGKYLGLEWNSDALKYHNYIRTGVPDPIDCYPLETKAYASYVQAIANKTGGNPVNILIRQHGNGLDMSYLRNVGQQAGNPDGFISLSGVTMIDQRAWEEAYEEMMGKAKEYTYKPLSFPMQ